MEKRDDIQPVILGGDIGAYSIARAFYDAYGVKSIVISRNPTGLVSHSVAIDNRVIPDSEDPEVLVAALQEIAKENPGKKLIGLGSADWLVRLLVDNRDRIEPQYILPYASAEQMDLVTDKVSFAELAKEHGVDHPETLIIDFADLEEPDYDSLKYPLILKPASTVAYHQVEFEGQKKVFLIQDEADLRETLKKIADSGFSDRFLLQEMIPGDDSAMRILTCYSDKDGKVRFGVFGRVIVEEHTPGALGNPAGIITQHNPEVVAQATRMLEAIGWKGYANFDIKYDADTGRYVFFELNPRLGRSNFYMTAAGVNPTIPYVTEWIDGQEPEHADPSVLPPHLFTVLPLRLLDRYVPEGHTKELYQALKKARRVTNPLWSSSEKHPKRLAYVLANQANQFKKFGRYYPRQESFTVGT